MKKWRKIMLALECMYLAISCAREFKKLWKKKKEKKKEEKDEDSS